MLFRIKQEAFNNILKHSKATKVVLLLTGSGDSVHYVISDNGQGFDTRAFRVPGENSGWGLVIMKERVSTNNGEFNILSEKGKGTTITVDMRG